MIGQAISVVSLALQSAGKVLYGTFLTAVPMPLFVLLSFCLAAGLFLALSRFNLPREGRPFLLLCNVSTAVTVIAFFYALKYLPPAVLAAIEIGTSLIVAAMVTGIEQRALPRHGRILACAGIIAGCALLAYAEASVPDQQADMTILWTAIAASVMAGISSTFSATSSRKLAAHGWAPREVLAHRFYLTIAVALAWFTQVPPETDAPVTDLFLAIVLVAGVGVIVPLLLTQIALRKIDELTLMICLAAQPLVSFLFAVPSPAYAWNNLTLAGVIVVTMFVGLDMATGKAQAGGRRLTIAVPPQRPLLLPAPRLLAAAT